MTYKVFISSRNNDKLFINGVSGLSLTEIRLYLQTELESEKLFGKDFLKILINETFDADATNDSYNECLKKVDEANYTIALTNGSAGWGAPSISIGICHAELARALEISQKQVSILDISAYFNYSTTDIIQQQRDKLFNAYISRFNRFGNPLKIAAAGLTEDVFKQQLLVRIKEIILHSIEKRIDASNHYFKLNGDSQKALQWKGMSFEIRNKEITALLANMIKTDYKDVLAVIRSIPANMSTQEALSFTGRSFLNDQEIIQDKANKVFKKGPIHFVGVYGNVTEAQVRSLLGNPDITTIKDDFGIYVWERSLNIQMVFFAKCSTPEATITNYSLFQIWCDSNELSALIIRRAEARYLILQAYIKAQKLLDAK